MEKIYDPNKRRIEVNFKAYRADYIADNVQPGGNVYVYFNKEAYIKEKHALIARLQHDPGVEVRGWDQELEWYLVVISDHRLRQRGVNESAWSRAQEHNLLG